MEQELIGLLQTAANASTSAEQRSITLSLARFNAHHDAITTYLSVFASAPLAQEVRGMAGLLLKNLIKRRDCSASLLQLAAEIIVGKVIGDTRGDCSPSLVLSTAATILAVVVDKDRRLWADTLYKLMRIVTACSSLSVIAGCLMCIERVLEEVGTGLSGTTDYSVLANLILILLSPDTHTSNVTVHQLCLKIINHLFSIARPGSIDIDSLLSHLSSCAISEDAEERRLTCQCLALICEYDSERVVESKPAIMSFMLRALCDVEEGVAMEACEYWHDLAERGDVLALETLSKLIPILVGKVIYSEEDPEVLQLPLDSADSVYSSSAAQPRHYHSRNGHERGGDVEDGEVDDSELESSEGYEEWTIRKCAASTIDHLSTSSPDTKLFLSILLPCCQELLNNPKFLCREAAILILGAIAEGCREEMEEEHMAALCPYVIANLRHEEALVRSISAWTISRYHSYIDRNSEHLQGAILSLSELLADEHVKCRRAACSALCIFLKSHALASHVNHIFEQIARALRTYSPATLPNLLDLITSLCDSQSEQVLRGCTAVQGIADELATRLLRTPEGDTAILYPLLDALSALTNVPSVFSISAHELYNYCIKMIGAILHAVQEENDAYAESEAAAAALDFVAALIVSGYAVCDDRLMNLVIYSSIADTVMLQSTFAVIGGIASKFPAFLQKHDLPQLVALLIEHFDPSQMTVDVAINAIWAWNHVLRAIPLDPAIIDKAVRELGRCLLLPNQSRSFYESAAVTIGDTLSDSQKLGSFNPDVNPIISRLSRILSSNANKDDVQKASAGLLSYICHADPLTTIARHPADILRIAALAGPHSAHARAILESVQMHIVGANGWEEWRRMNIPDVPVESLRQH